MPSSPFLGALAYIRERRVGLSVYLDDADVVIDTNHLERALYVIPMGGRNWLFCWAEPGAEHVGIVQSLIATCYINDINPCGYFVDVLQRISQHPASLVHQLTPRVWKQIFADNPLRSDLYELDWTGVTGYDEALLQYLSPLGWEHIILTGDYLWRSSANVGAGKFRPLRTFAMS